MFGATIQNGEQRAVIQLPATGKSAHGKDVPLENLRLELADPADSSKATVEAHPDGTAGKFTVRGADGLADPPPDQTVGVALKARADGQPGAGVSDIEEDGMVSIVGPNANNFGGAISGAAEALP